MGTNSDSLASQIKQYRERHPNCKNQDLYEEFTDAKQDTIDRTVRRQNQSISKQSKSKKKDKGTSNGQSGSNSINTPVSLTKIDDDVVEKYLCSLIDLDDPKENIARLIVSWIERKGRMKVEIPKEEKSIEERDKDFKMIMDGSKNFISNINLTGSS